MSEQIGVQVETTMSNRNVKICADLSKVRPVTGSFIRNVARNFSWGLRVNFE